MTLHDLTEFASNHLMLSLALVGLTLALAYTEVARLFQGFKALAPGQLTALVNHENALVVDLRSGGEGEVLHGESS